MKTKTKKKLGPPTLGDDRNEAARQYLQRVVNEDFQGFVSRAARPLDVTTVTLADFLSGRRGAGLKLIDAVAAYRGVPIDVVLGRANALPPPASVNDDPSALRVLAVRAMRLVTPQVEDSDAWERAIRATERLPAPLGDRPVPAWILLIIGHYELLRATQPSAAASKKKPATPPKRSRYAGR